MKPRLLDAYCGAGGAAMGYHRTGFDVVGVDLAPQPRYPFEFHQGDAVEFIRDHGHEFDAIHTSPPCQRYSKATPHARRVGYPDLVSATRAALVAAGRPWVIENVPGAPVRPDIVICGCEVGLALRRVRWFETSWQHFSLRGPCVHAGPVVSVVGHGSPTSVRESLGYNPTIADWRAAMGIDWMGQDELSEAIPPAYTELVGGFLREHLSGHPGALEAAVVVGELVAGEPGGHHVGEHVGEQLLDRPSPSAGFGDREGVRVVRQLEGDPHADDDATGSR